MSVNTRLINLLVHFNLQKQFSSQAEALIGHANLFNEKQGRAKEWSILSTSLQN